MENGGHLMDTSDDRRVPICIDGANVAFSHERGTGTPSIPGILLVREYFKRRGHTVVIFVPGGRRSLARLPQQLVVFEQLTASRELVTCPAQTSDDLFMIDYAKRKAGYLVSNDLFRDHVLEWERLFGEAEARALRDWCDTHVITYSWLGDEFLPHPQRMREAGLAQRPPSPSWEQAPRENEGLVTDHGVSHAHSNGVAVHRVLDSGDYFQGDVGLASTASRFYGGLTASSTVASKPATAASAAPPGWVAALSASIATSYPRAALDAMLCSAWAAVWTVVSRAASGDIVTPPLERMADIFLAEYGTSGTVSSDAAGTMRPYPFDQVAAPLDPFSESSISGGPGAVIKSACEEILRDLAREFSGKMALLTITRTGDAVRVECEARNCATAVMAASESTLGAVADRAGSGSKDVVILWTPERMRMIARMVRQLGWSAVT